MNGIVAVVHLDSGLVLDLPGNTPTFDVPEGFDRSASGPHLRPVGRALSRRKADEEFLLRQETDDSATGGPRWLLTVREPRAAR